MQANMAVVRERVHTLIGVRELAAFHELKSLRRVRKLEEHKQSRRDKVIEKRLKLKDMKES